MKGISDAACAQASSGSPNDLRGLVFNQRARSFAGNFTAPAGAIDATNRRAVWSRMPSNIKISGVLGWRAQFVLQGVRVALLQQMRRIIRKRRCRIFHNVAWSVTKRSVASISQFLIRLDFLMRPYLSQHKSSHHAQFVFEREGPPGRLPQQ